VGGTASDEGRNNLRDGGNFGFPLVFSFFIFASWWRGKAIALQARGEHGCSGDLYRGTRSYVCVCGAGWRPLADERTMCCHAYVMCICGSWRHSFRRVLSPSLPMVRSTPQATPSGTRV
jgi:hypothetical protein